MATLRGLGNVCPRCRDMSGSGDLREAADLSLPTAAYQTSFFGKLRVSLQRDEIVLGQALTKHPSTFREIRAGSTVRSFHMRYMMLDSKHSRFL